MRDFAQGVRRATCQQNGNTYRSGQTFHDSPQITFRLINVWVEDGKACTRMQRHVGGSKLFDIKHAT